MERRRSCDYPGGDREHRQPQVAFRESGFNEYVAATTLMASPRCHVGQGTIYVKGAFNPNSRIRPALVQCRRSAIAHRDNWILRLSTHQAVAGASTSGTRLAKSAFDAFRPDR